MYDETFSKEELITILKEKDKLLSHKDRVSLLGESIEDITDQWKNPLISIYNSANNLQIKNILGLVDEITFSKELDNIIRNTDYLIQTISDVASFCKDSKYLCVLNINTLINKVLSIASLHLESKNIQITTNLDDECFVKCVENELMQVLLNIINNAVDILKIKHKDEREIIIRTIRDDNNVQIEIEDSAGGISEDLIDKIFDKYFTTKGEKGSGVGLFVSKQIIEEHFFGKLSVYNGQKGACFVIRLPLYEFINQENIMGSSL